MSIHRYSRGFPGGSNGKESACNAWELDSIPELGRCPGEGNGNPLQYSCLGNPMDRGAWQATVHGVTRVRHDWVTKPTNQRTRENLQPNVQVLQNQLMTESHSDCPRGAGLQTSPLELLVLLFSFQNLKIFTWRQKTAGQTAIFPIVCTNEAIIQQQQQHTGLQRAVINGEKDGAV